MGSCVFCRIIAGTLPASLVFQDAEVIAFMDIQPVTEGHTLLIPVAHAPNIADVDGATTGHLFDVARRITKALYQALGCDGINWFVADGEAAGQEVSHMHLHLIPRYRNDGSASGSHRATTSPLSAKRSTAQPTRSVTRWAD